jgi:hypothetical protein
MIVKSTNETKDPTTYEVVDIINNVECKVTKGAMRCKEDGS